MTYDGLNHYVYDTDGRICAVCSPGPVYTQYLYDAEGRRVAKGAIPLADWPAATCNPPLSGRGFAATALYLRGVHGDQDTELTGSGGSWVQANIFVNGGVTATFWNSGSGPDASYTFPDWLGSKQRDCQDECEQFCHCATGCIREQ